MTVSPALAVPPADPQEAARFFISRLTFQADVADVHASMTGGAPGFVLVDSRSRSAWDQGHVPGAVHLPTREIRSRAQELIDPATPVITYCWGPGCDGATRAALAFAQLGYQVKEMIGGMEYWIREGLPVESFAGTAAGPVDHLVGVTGISCDC